MPRVSVIVPAYNAQAHLRNALETVLAQSYRDYELIVVDDGSNDATRTIAESYPAVRYVGKENGGVAHARNCGVQHARGELIAFLDADDQWHPGKLAAQVALMDRHPECDLCRTRATREAARFADDVAAWDGRHDWPHTVVKHYRDSFLDPYFGTPTLMVRREAFIRVGGYNEQLRIAEDVDFHLRLLLNRPQVVVVEHPTVYILELPDGLSADSAAGYLQLLEVYRALVNRYPERFAGQRMMVREAFAMLHLRHGASLLRRQRNGAGILAGLRSILWYPTREAVLVCLRGCMPSGMQRWRLARSQGRR
jgi:glycosyltransferase involved in cell wall biosynthesis